LSPEVQALMKKSRDSLEAANLLRTQNYHDFAAGRAYFAMFYVAEALLATLNQSFSSHKATISAFGKEFSKTGKLDTKFHRELIDAEELRGAGDYSSGPAITPEQSEQVCGWAKEFLEVAWNHLSVGGDPGAET